MNALQQATAIARKAQHKASKHFATCHHANAKVWDRLAPCAECDDHGRTVAFARHRVRVIKGLCKPADNGGAS